MAAISQISRRGSQGRGYYEKKLTEGMGRKAALRALKRKISDARYARMLDDAHRRQDPGGQSGNDAATSAAGSHPETPALRTSHSRATANSALAISACSHLGLLLIDSPRVLWRLRTHGEWESCQHHGSTRMSCVSALSDL